MAISFASHGSQEVQHRGPAPAGPELDVSMEDAGDEEDEAEAQLAGDVAKMPELAVEGGGHTERVASVSDRVRSPGPSKERH